MRQTGQVHIVACLSDSRRDIGFIDHFNTQLVITLNYSAIANSHTLQIQPAVSSLVVAW
jgi:ethanolamine utilization microcompartment shell protein EutS